MKEVTKISTYVGFGFLIAGILNTEVTLGLIAMGLFAFSFMYDEKFRRMF